MEKSNSDSHSYVAYVISATSLELKGVAKLIWSSGFQKLYILLIMTFICWLEDPVQSGLSK